MAMQQFEKPIHKGILTGYLHFGISPGIDILFTSVTKENSNP